MVAGLRFRPQCRRHAPRACRGPHGKGAIRERWRRVLLGLSTPPPPVRWRSMADPHTVSTRGWERPPVSPGAGSGTFALLPIGELLFELCHLVVEVCTPQPHPRQSTLHSTLETIIILLSSSACPDSTSPLPYLTPMHDRWRTRCSAPAVLVTCSLVRSAIAALVCARVSCSFSRSAESAASCWIFSARADSCAKSSILA
jgi:hypothetical protein